MKAVVVEEFGPPEALTINDIPAPDIGPMDVLVDVACAGVGYVDGLLVQGLYQVKPPLPYSPGSEFSGTVAAVGKDVPHLKPGRRVMGVAMAGAFAQQLSQNCMSCIPVPDGMSDEVAASFVLSYCTVIYGLRDCGKMQEGETLLVLGASGGVGAAAIAVGKAMGLKVIGAASTEAKRQAAFDAGADAVIDYSNPDWRDELKGLTKHSGLDAVFDPVGGDVAEAALRSLSPGGRHLVVGFASGTIPKVGFNIALLKRASIVGVDWGGAMRADPAIVMGQMQQLLAWFIEGKLTPAPVDVREFKDVAQVMRDQLDRKFTRKVVLRVS